MKYINKKHFGYGLVVATLVLVGVNIYQYLEFINLPYYNGDEVYGFPFGMYEYYISFHTGSILLWGVIANILFTVTVGCILGVFISLVSNKNNLG